MIITLQQAKDLVEFFGDEDAEVNVTWLDYAHSGPGLYASLVDYPDEGCQLLGSDTPSPRKRGEANGS